MKWFHSLSVENVLIHGLWLKAEKHILSMVTKFHHMFPKLMQYDLI